MLEIRQVTGEEIVDYAFPLANYAFETTPSDDKREDWLKRVPYLQSRYYAVGFENGTPVATANNIPMTQNLRGKIYPMGGVAGVAVHPSARRKGYARQMLQYIFQHTAEAGQVVSTLYPFRESFYARLGYTGFAQVHKFHFDPRQLTKLLHMDIAGRVEVMPFKDGYDIYRHVSYKRQEFQHGMAVRDDNSYWREFAKIWLAVAYDDEDQVVGLMYYKIEGYGKDFTVPRFLHLTSQGKYLLMQWIARHADQTYTASVITSPDEHMEMWFTDLEGEVKMGTLRTGYDAVPMGRIIHIDDLSGMHTGEGAFVAQIIDDQCAWNNSIYRFETADGRLSVERTETARPDAVLNINGISALVFSGYEPGDLFYRGWSEPVSQEIQTVMRSMFPSAHVFLNESF